MNIGLIVTHGSDGSPASVDRMHLIAKHLAEIRVNTTVLARSLKIRPTARMFYVKIVPSSIPKIGLTFIAYRLFPKDFAEQISVFSPTILYGTRCIEAP